MQEDKASTKVYGYSDDVVQFWGKCSDSIDCYDTDLRITLSDGTVLRTHYGKHLNGQDCGIWSIEVEYAGLLYDRKKTCYDEEDEPYSDIVYFKDGELSIIDVTRE